MKDLEKRIKKLEQDEKRREQWEIIKSIKHAISSQGYSELKKIYKG